jgi:hypothetical protein
MLWSAPLPWLWAPSCATSLYVDELYGVDRDRLLRVVGARGRLARPPHLGRHRRRRRVALRLWAQLNRLLDTTGSTAASTKPARSFPPAAACCRASKSGRVQNYLRILAARRRRARAILLEQPAMNVLRLPTYLTLSPCCRSSARLLALFSGRHARAVALFTTLASLLLALFIWTRLPADGSMGLVERVAWAPSLGIEYHLGVDGLGALMLVLSAIVTLMSVDAAHRVHHQPGLYFGLVLTLESGLFGSFTALNFFHWFLFWELSLIPAFFLIKLWGGRARPAATQFFVYTMAGSVASCCLAISLRRVQRSRQHGLRESRGSWPHPASWRRWSPRISARDAVARHRRSRRLRRQSAA